VTKSIPEIANLSHSERKSLIERVSTWNSSDEKEKHTVLEALGLIDKLIMDLETSKVSISALKKLFGFKSEQIKKFLQMS
jgi:hypothetical protein